MEKRARKDGEKKRGMRGEQMQIKLERDGKRCQGKARSRGGGRGNAMPGTKKGRTGARSPWQQNSLLFTKVNGSQFGSTPYEIRFNKVGHGQPWPATDSHRS